MKKKLMVLSGFVLGLAPVVALAQITDINSNLSDSKLCATGQIGSWLCKISQLVAGVLPILIALAVVYFVWGIISFVIADEEEAKTKGRDRIIYGIIGLTVIVAVWGLVEVLGNTFGVNRGENVSLPGVPDLTNPNINPCADGWAVDSGTGKCAKD